MVEVFNSLKGRNKFLKAHLAETRKVAGGVIEEEPNSSEAEQTCSATAMPPIFMQNQPPPSLVPCFWLPPMAPSSDTFSFQCTSHPHPLQFPMDTPHQGQELSTVTPLFIVPVPWLLPLHAHSSTGGTNTHYCGKCSCSDARMSEEAYNNNQSCSTQNTMRAEAAYNPIMKTMSADGDRRAHEPPAAIVVPGLFSPVRRMENLDPPRACQVGDVVPSHETGLFQGKPEDIIVATEARRRRKELMRLKKVN